MVGKGSVTQQAKPTDKENFSAHSSASILISKCTFILNLLPTKFETQQPDSDQTTWLNASNVEQKLAHRRKDGQ